MEQINHCEVCKKAFIGYSVYLHKEKLNFCCWKCFKVYNKRKQDEYRIEKSGLNRKIKQVKAIIDLYQLKIWDLEKTVIKLHKEKHDLLKEFKREY